MTLQFGSSGIRGKYPDQVSSETAFELGKVLTKELGSNLALGGDPRYSGAVLRASFLSSVLESGAKVTDYGLVPTPALAYETAHTGMDGGVMITASHNPVDYNGFKIFNSQGESIDDAATLSGLSAQRKDRFSGRSEVSCEQPTEYRQMLSEIRFNKKWRIILDPGNGATGSLAASVYANAVGKATSINSQPDGKYPARGSEPTLESVSLLRKVVAESKADLGIAFDGDGDRFYVVDEKGNCPLQDRVLAAYLFFLSKGAKGPFLVPVDASMAVDEVVSKNGAKIIRGPVGDAKLLAEMKRDGLSFAGEPSGAWIHGNFHPCPDGLLSGLLYMRELERSGMTASEAVSMIPEYHMVRKSVSLGKGLTSPDISRLSIDLEKIVGSDSRTDSRFGVRVSSGESWILVRESGTEPLLRVTAESKNLTETNRIVHETLELISHFSMGPG